MTHDDPPDRHAARPATELPDELSRGGDRRGSCGARGRLGDRTSIGLGECAASRPRSRRRRLLDGRTPCCRTWSSPRRCPGVDVLFLETGYHFAETHADPRRGRARSLHVTIVDVLPRADRRRAGRRVRPAAVRPRPEPLLLRCARSSRWPGASPATRLWVTGVRRVEAPTRADTPLVAWDDAHDLVKVNPLAAWSDDDVAGLRGRARRAASTRWWHRATPRSAARRAPGRWPRARTRAPAAGRAGQDRMRAPHMSRALHRNP